MLLAEKKGEWDDPFHIQTITSRDGILIIDHFTLRRSFRYLMKEGSRHLAGTSSYVLYKRRSRPFRAAGE